MTQFKKLLLCLKDKHGVLHGFCLEMTQALLPSSMSLVRLWGLLVAASEEIIFGEPEVTSGAADDLQQATEMTKQMVMRFGMSEIGPWAFLDPVVQSGDIVLRMMARNSMSEKLAEDMDNAVKGISDNAYEVAKSHIRSNQAPMDKIVEILLEKETLSGDEFWAILSEFTEIPVSSKNVQAAPQLASV